ncbi:hypothetical protein EPI10_018862 [Gossypium australe]|uniref:Uncharacterized protein n=1 Tax=Gossypium australe TaxID=47621 RepID=A0A5B6UDJ9_9ROSI|nr:hypothetical protein EPI10_018862 [Gossypium australe]
MKPYPILHRGATIVPSQCYVLVVFLAALISPKSKSERNLYRPHWLDPKRRTRTDDLHLWLELEKLLNRKTLIFMSHGNGRIPQSTTLDRVNGQYISGKLMLSWDSLLTTLEAVTLQSS